MGDPTSSAWASFSTSCLTGRRPFRGDTLVEVMEQITTTEPRPPRQTDEPIPKELERICQKALAKRASERYSTAKDMAEDLRLFLQTTGGTVVAGCPCGSHDSAAWINLGMPRHRRSRPGNPTRAGDRSRSSRRGCDPSMRRMPTSSWNCFPDPGTGMVCLKASDSGRARSSRSIPT